MAKKKIKLSLDLEYNFRLIGLASPENDYRISWIINNELSFKFVKANDLIINNPKFSEPQHFAVYIWEDEYEYKLIANKCSNGFLIEEYKNVDFFLQINNDPPEDVCNDVLNNIKNIKSILTAFPIDAENLKSKQKLIF